MTNTSLAPTECKGDVPDCVPGYWLLKENIISRKIGTPGAPKEVCNSHYISGKHAHTAKRNVVLFVRSQQRNFKLRFVILIVWGRVEVLSVVMQQLSRVWGQKITDEKGWVWRKDRIKGKITRRRKTCRQLCGRMMDTERQKQRDTRRGCTRMSNGYTANTALWGYNLRITILIIYSTHLLHK